ncbi:MAG TPA: glycosyltransferase family protein [Vicinamibacterales bacterium]|jgi:spore coat polysaccharide biosynthesis protein SpsF
MRIVVVVQARTGSSRLPGKVLMPLANRPLLQRMLERVLAANTPSEVVVATTRDRMDDVIETIAKKAGVACVRGHATDLLDRHYSAGLAFEADAVVKIPSDCPLIDPIVIDRVIGYYTAHADNADFVSNLHPPSYPDGNDVEVMPFRILETAWIEACETHEREHTTPFIWERPARFRIHNIAWESGLDYSTTHRWTIDYFEDYQLLAAVYEALWMEARPIFSLRDVLSLLEARPDIAALNACHAGKSWHRDRVRTAPVLHRNTRGHVDA